MSANKKLIRSTGIIGSAIMSSRVLGFVRDVVFAKLFGTNTFAQAFVVAFRIPNMLREMVGEGAASAAIVPVLTEYRHKSGPREFWEASEVILNLMLVTLVTISATGVIFAPALIKIVAPGFLNDPVKFQTAVSLTRWLFPYIIFVGLVAYSKGVLNSLQYFTTSEFAGAALNASMIISLLFLCRFMGINGLVLGVLVGGVIQVAMQVPPLFDRGFRIEKRFRLVHPVAARIGKLLAPRMLGSAVYQLSVLVDTVLASFGGIVGPGGVAGLYYANRLLQLPLGIFAISLATAVLPRMSKEVALKDIDKLKGTISFSLETVFISMVPAAVGLMVLAKPIIKMLFQRGEFTTYSTAITSSALFYYAIGLFAYAGVKILVSAYYSMGDTRTPVKAASAALVINLVLNLILMRPLKIGGLALATSIASTANFITLYVVLVSRIGDIGTRAILNTLMRILAAGVVMFCFTFLMRAGLALDSASGIKGLVSLGGAIAVSGVVYLAAAHMTGVANVRKLWAHIRKKGADTE